MCFYSDIDILLTIYLLCSFGFEIHIDLLSAPLQIHALGIADRNDNVKTKAT